MTKLAGTFVRAAQGDMVDLIAWRHYGHRPGIVEAIFEVNPGLADFGPVLPLGTVVFLPSIPKPSQVAPTISLWG